MKGKGQTDVSVHASVHGRVQGVGFRYSTRAMAHRLGLTGWVRNCADGSVEVVCEGESRKVEDLLAWLAKGPPGARVIRVDRREIPYSGAYRTFTVEF